MDHIASSLSLNFILKKLDISFEVLLEVYIAISPDESSRSTRRLATVLVVYVIRTVHVLIKDQASYSKLNFRLGSACIIKCLPQLPSYRPCLEARLYLCTQGG